jgi:hypothetical protein
MGWNVREPSGIVPIAGIGSEGNIVWELGNWASDYVDNRWVMLNYGQRGN